MSERRLELVVRQVPLLQHHLNKQGGQRQFLLTFKSKVTKTRQSARLKFQPRLLRRLPPPLHHPSANHLQMLRHLLPPKLPNRRQRCHRPNPFCPIRTADKSRLRRLHHFFPPQHHRHGVPVCDRLRKHRHIRRHIEQHVNPAIRHAESCRDFVKNQYRTNRIRHTPHLLQKPLRRLRSPLRLHHNRRHLPGISRHDRL